MHLIVDGTLEHGIDRHLPDIILGVSDLHHDILKIALRKSHFMDLVLQGGDILGDRNHIKISLQRFLIAVQVIGLQEEALGILRIQVIRCRHCAVMIYISEEFLVLDLRFLFDDPVIYDGCTNEPAVSQVPVRLQLLPLQGGQLPVFLPGRRIGLHLVRRIVIPVIQDLHQQILCEGGLVRKSRQPVRQPGHIQFIPDPAP